MTVADPTGGYAEGESWKTGSSVKRANMEAFVEWLLTPVVEREYPTRVAFAEFLGVTTQTLRNYERDLFVVNSLANRRKSAFKVERADKVVDALYAKALDPDGGGPSVTAARTLLDWMEKQTTEMNVEAMRDLSDAELKQMLVEMFDKL